jgi:hypothetical protein
MAVSEIRPAVESDAAVLAMTIRQEDREEIVASDGPDVYDTILESVRRSEEAWALLIDGELACIWGVVRSPNGLGSVADGVVWMLSTNVINRKPKTFWRECKRLVPELVARWGLLVNAIDIRHEKAIRWGNRLGFRFTNVSRFGIGGNLFAFFSVGG